MRTKSIPYTPIPYELLTNKMCIIEVYHYTSSPFCILEMVQLQLSARFPCNRLHQQWHRGTERQCKACVPKTLLRRNTISTNKDRCSMFCQRSGHFVIDRVNLYSLYTCLYHRNHYCPPGG